MLMLAESIRNGRGLLSLVLGRYLVHALYPTGLQLLAKGVSLVYNYEYYKTYILRTQHGASTISHELFVILHIHAPLKDYLVL